jgi:hypothetical protein
MGEMNRASAKILKILVRQGHMSGEACKLVLEIAQWALECPYLAGLKIGRHETEWT